MKRRRFLKLAGLASVGALLKVSFWAEPAAAASIAAFHGKLYRGDPKGRIYVSVDGGQTWQLHTYLGPQYAVRRLATDRHDRVRVTIGFRGRSFGLVLAPDELMWRTV